MIAGIYAALGPAMAVDPCAAPRIMSAPFSAIIIVAALVLPETTVGNDRSIDHPQTLDAMDPQRGVDHRICVLPIMQVLVGW